MLPLACFGISVAMSFGVWGIVGAAYVWPALRTQSRADALRPLLLLHSARFIGLAFLVPGVVSPRLPAAFARPAAYGDFIASVLALLAFVGLESGVGVAMVWLFNIWGSADLIFAFYQGICVRMKPGQLGAAYFIPTVAVPLLMVTHVLVFRLLLRGNSVDPTRERQLNH